MQDEALQLLLLQWLQGSGGRCSASIEPASSQGSGSGASSEPVSAQGGGSGATSDSASTAASTR